MSLKSKPLAVSQHTDKYDEASRQAWQEPHWSAIASGSMCRQKKHGGLGIIKRQIEQSIDGCIKDDNNGMMNIFHCRPKRVDSKPTECLSICGHVDEHCSYEQTSTVAR